MNSAAFKDMVSVAQRRFPLVELIVASTKVQGDGAAENISKNIKLLDARGDLDTIIIGRGGGSLEDLWAFNEESLAHTIFDCNTPIISGVGHEIDFTIADFVADLRAPTPSASMELATPNQEDILNYITEFYENSSSILSSIIVNFKEQISSVINSYGFKSHSFIINNNMQTLDSYLYRIDNGMNHKLSSSKSDLKYLQSLIDSYSVEKVLERGYTIVKQNEKIITRAVDFDSAKKTNIKFYDKEVEIK
jgi:exodeoxyribonuclease VII large subunit